MEAIEKVMNEVPSNVLEEPMHVATNELTLNMVKHQACANVILKKLIHVATFE